MIGAFTIPYALDMHPVWTGSLGGMSSRLLMHVLPDPTKPSSGRITKRPAGDILPVIDLLLASFVPGIQLMVTCSILQSAAG